MSKTETLDLDFKAHIAKQGPKYLIIIPSDLKEKVEESDLLNRKLNVSVKLSTI